MKDAKQIFFIMLLLAGPGAVRAAEAAADSLARAAIDAGNAAYIRAMGQADADIFADVYDADGARLEDDGEITRGRDAIRAELAEVFARIGPIAFTITTAALWVIDDLAYETGGWTLSYTRAGGEAVERAGRYVTVWRRQADGGWKIYRDMDVPLQ